MTKNDLIQFLQDTPGNPKILLSHDGEGNGFGEFGGMFGLEKVKGKTVLILYPGYKYIELDE